MRSCRGILLILVLTAAIPRSLWAETSVPLDLQVELLWKVVRFERGFVERGRDVITLVLVVRPGSPESARAAARLAKLLERSGEVARKPVNVVLHSYASAAQLKAEVLAASAQLVYLTPGLDSEIPAIAGALSGVPVIIVSTDGDQVELGVVLAFALVSGRPRIALNLGQARRQGLDFNSDLFRLARVIR